MKIKLNYLGIKTGKQLNFFYKLERKQKYCCFEINNKIMYIPCEKYNCEKLMEFLLKEEI